ncbi:MAG: NAD(+) synthase [Sedimentisphaerales bacterium]|jgi:NAD+ synthase|nr:NAD(+) synthase [Sedimentisphaerales bacterium]
MSQDRLPCSDWLKIDCQAEVERICGSIRQQVLKDLRKRGVVVALSGGIDSSLVGALCVHALGRERVFGLSLPERESSPDTARLSSMIIAHLGIDSATIDITPILESAGCYRFRDEAVQKAWPAYGPGCKCKIVLPSLIDGDRLNVFSVVIRQPDGAEVEVKLGLEPFLGIVAATNFKQRVRKMMEYYHADRLNYAVAGTPNRLEYDQGFFVKLGDGAADIKPIAHLYKTQVYQLARYLGIPEEICSRPPTTDTYPMSQTQEEFFFAVPYQILDLCLYAKEHQISVEQTADVTGLTADQVRRILRDIDAKRRAARYLHAPPLLVGQGLD